MVTANSTAIGIPENTIFFFAEIAPEAHDSDGNARWAVTKDHKFFYSRNNQFIPEEKYSAPDPEYFLTPLQEIRLKSFPEKQFNLFLLNLKDRPLCKGEESDDGSKFYLFYKILDDHGVAVKSDMCFSVPGDVGMKAIQHEFFQIFENFIDN